MSLRMPAIWSSSERPISVRTVWVDGVRHAILSADDPLVRQGGRKTRPRTSRGSNYADEGYYPVDISDAEELGECFVKLHLVASLNDRSEKNSAPGSLISGRNSPAGILKGKCQRRENKVEAERVFYPIGDTARPEKNPAKIIISPGKNDRSDFCDEIDQGHCKLPEIQQNSLSERVLQWLDLSGRVKEYQRTKNSALNSSKDAVGSVRKKSAPESGFRRRGSSAVIIPKERVIVQNYTLQPGQSREKDRGKRAGGTAAEEDVCSGASQHPQRRGESDSVSEIPPVRSYFVEKINTATNDRRVSILKSQFIEGEEDAKQSLWSPPRKPQLHIFMPSLISPVGEKISSSQEQQSTVERDQQF